MTDEKKPKLPPPLPQGKFPPKPNQGAKLPLPPLAGPKAAPKFPTAAPMMPPVRTPERQAAQSELQVEAHGASSSELEEMRKQMDAQISGLQRQLQEEREKLLLQTVRAKEEEALASKVEESPAPRKKGTGTPGFHYKIRIADKGHGAEACLREADLG